MHTSSCVFITTYIRRNIIICTYYTNNTLSLIYNSCAEGDLNSNILLPESVSDLK